MRWQYDSERKILRIDDGKFGAIYFIIENRIDPSTAVLFEMGQSGRCVALDTPEAKNKRKEFDDTMLIFADEHQILIKKKEEK